MSVFQFDLDIVAREHQADLLREVQQRRLRRAARETEATSSARRISREHRRRSG